MNEYLPPEYMQLMHIRDLIVKEIGEAYCIKIQIEDMMEKMKYNPSQKVLGEADSLLDSPPGIAELMELHAGVRHGAGSDS